MNITAKIILSTTTALLASITFAKTELSCPPIATFKSESTFNSVLIDAKPVYAFLSNPYSYDDRNWVTFFGGMFDESIQTNDEALSAGNKVFQDLMLSEPKVEEDGEAGICVYFEGNESTPFFAAALTPAEMMPSPLTYRVKKFLK